MAVVELSAYSFSACEPGDEEWISIERDVNCIFPDQSAERFGITDLVRAEDGVFRYDLVYYNPSALWRSQREVQMAQMFEFVDSEGERHIEITIQFYRQASLPASTRLIAVTRLMEKYTPWYEYAISAMEKKWIERIPRRLAIVLALYPRLPYEMIRHIHSLVPPPRAMPGDHVSRLM